MFNLLFALVHPFLRNTNFVCVSTQAHACLELKLEMCMTKAPLASNELLASETGSDDVMDENTGVCLVSHYSRIGVALIRFVSQRYKVQDICWV